MSKVKNIVSLLGKLDEKSAKASKKKRRDEGLKTADEREAASQVSLEDMDDAQEEAYWQMQDEFALADMDRGEQERFLMTLDPEDAGENVDQFDFDQFEDYIDMLEPQALRRLKDSLNPEDDSLFITLVEDKLDEVTELREAKNQGGPPQVGFGTFVAQHQDMQSAVMSATSEEEMKKRAKEHMELLKSYPEYTIFAEQLKRQQKRKGGGDQSEYHEALDKETDEERFDRMVEDLQQFEGMSPEEAEMMYRLVTEKAKEEKLKEYRKNVRKQGQSILDGIASEVKRNTKAEGGNTFANAFDALQAEYKKEKEENEPFSLLDTAPWEKDARRNVVPEQTETMAKGGKAIKKLLEKKPSRQQFMTASKQAGLKDNEANAIWFAMIKEAEKVEEKASPSLLKQVDEEPTEAELRAIEAEDADTVSPKTLDIFEDLKPEDAKPKTVKDLDMKVTFVPESTVKEEKVADETLGSLLEDTRTRGGKAHTASKSARKNFEMIKRTVDRLEFKDIKSDEISPRELKRDLKKELVEFYKTRVPTPETFNTESEKFIFDDKKDVYRIVADWQKRTKAEFGFDPLTKRDAALINKFNVQKKAGGGSLMMPVERSIYV